MQMAILLVLILIAVLIAPWLIGVIVAAAALYGAWIFAVAAIALAIVVAVSLYGSMKALNSKRRVNRQIEESNRIIAEKERLRRGQNT